MGSAALTHPTLAPSVTSATNTNIAAAGGGSFATQQSGADPLDLVTGSYTYNHQDLSVGSGPYPDTLPFVRYFDSGLAQAERNSSLLGNGWMHNYDLTALPDSDGFEGMADNSPISGAASIAAFYVLQDILNIPATQTNKLPLERIIMAAQAESWLMQQLTNNVVSVTQPGSIERYTKLTNGNYNPPIGSATVLSGSSIAGYTYQSGNGISLNFNPVAATASGKVTSWSNAAGATIAFSYNSLGELQSVCEPNCASPRRQLNLSYTSNRLTSVNDNTGSLPRTVTYGYDGSNDLTSVTDTLGYKTSFAYAGVGQLTKIFYPSTPSNPFISMTYDTLGRPNTQADANGDVTTLYLAGTRAETVDPVGTARVSYFTPRGKTLATIDGLGSATINSGAGNLTSYTYDGLDRVLTTTQPAGGVKSFTYDTYSNPLTIISTPAPSSPLSPLTQSFSYVSPVSSLPNFEEVQTATDPLGLVTNFGYDANGNRTKIIADAGTGAHFNAISRFTYDSQGRVLTATDPLGTVTQYTYDSLGDQTAITRDSGRLNNFTRFTYSPVGDLLTTTDPNGNVTTNLYDAMRRVTSTTLPAAPVRLVTTTTYDPNGYVLEIQQSANGTVLRGTTSTYTLAGKVATSTDANGNVTRYGYDAADRLASVTDPLGNVTDYGYDALSRPNATSNPTIQANPLSQKTYTPDGLPASLTIARSNTVFDTTSFAYDGFDRLSTTTYPNGKTELYSYDADSNILTRVTRKAVTITLTYDTLNRLATKTVPGEATVTYTYDLAGHNIGVSDNSAAITVPAASASYGESASYDALNRPLGVTWTPAAAQTVPTASSSSFTFGYDANNRRISQSATDKSWWSYPATAATTNYTPNNLNQYTTVGPVSPTYDSNGNLTTDGSYIYCYDAEGRVIAILGGGTCASPTTTVGSYAYDAQGRRKSKTVGSTTTIYVTDADNREVLEYNGTTGSGALLRWYSFAPGSTDGVLNQMTVTGTATRATLIPDIQGSLIGSLASTGTLTKSGYQPFGQNPSLTSSANPGFYYTGRRLDPETTGSVYQPNGLYYYRARVYSPTLGRFIQVDPSGYAAGNNLYAYVNNDPLNLIDPYGLTPDSPLQTAISTLESSPLLAASVAATVIAGGGPEDPAAVIAAVGEIAAAEAESAAEGGALTAAQQLAVNRAAGAAFEQSVGASLEGSGLTIGQQISVQTGSGITTRLDFLTQDPETGEISCIECKASQTAPLTRNQTLGFPEIEQSGGTILGAGKPGFPGGMQIPPTAVQIIRGP